jgi:hypothetical protein
MTEFGIQLSVLRSASGDCTNGGISAEHAYLWLVDLPYSVHHAGMVRRVPAGAPTVRLTQTTPGYNVLVPTNGRQTAHLIGPMAGGNYAIAQYGDDAKAWKLLGLSGAIPVHDRFETQAQYDALTR